MIGRAARWVGRWVSRRTVEPAEAFVEDRAARVNGEVRRILRELPELPRWVGAAAVAGAVGIVVVDAHQARSGSGDRPADGDTSSPEGRLREALDTLGVTPPATRDDLDAAWRERAAETHPDAGGDAETFKQAREAYETATNAEALTDGRSDTETLSVDSEGTTGTCEDSLSR